MKHLGLPKTALIRKPGEYQRIYAGGRRLRGDNFALVYRLADAAPTKGQGPRMGISVSGVKSAVRRNRIKRIIREFFRLHRAAFNPALEMVFTVRRDFTLATPAEIAAALAGITAGRAEIARLPTVPKVQG
ncbi:MAG: ribonuclease P protein component [Desulfurivibrio sp.]